ncbi:MAG: hypothetical protein ACLFRG_22825 [Desulfococcaceae bacterium]
MDQINFAEMYADLERILREERREMDRERDEAAKMRNTIHGEIGRLRATIERAENTGADEAVVATLRRIDRAIACALLGLEEGSL